MKLLCSAVHTVLEGTYTMHGRCMGGGGDGGWRSIENQHKKNPYMLTWPSVERK